MLITKQQCALAAKEANSLLGLHQKESCQSVKGGNPSPLFSTGDAVSGVTAPVLSSLVQERHRHTRMSPVKGHKDDG